MKLTDLKTGEEAVIIKIHGHGAFRKRCIEMGFVNGRVVKVELYAPLKDPVKYSIMGYEVSLRRSEASLIEVEPLNESTKKNTDNDNSAKTVSQSKERIRDINIALLGNPNCGKTSLFNIASGAHEHVGNYSGVTVDAKAGHFNYKGYRFNIVDLPGTYSLTSYSPEELYVRNYLREELPDVIVNVIDASNLERNLYLTTELIDMDRSMVIALNMYDELRNSGARLDYKLLGKMIGVPMVPIVAKTGEGVNNLFDNIITVFEGRNEDVRHIHVNLGTEKEKLVRILIDELKSTSDVPLHFSPRYIAIKLLEGDPEASELLSQISRHDEIIQLRDKLVKDYETRCPGEDLATGIAGENMDLLMVRWLRRIYPEGKIIYPLHILLINL